MLGTLKKISDGVEKAVVVVAIMTFIAMTVSACVQVISRYCFSFSPPWTEELCRYCFIWTNALGATICYKHGAHAVVDFHIKLLPEKIGAVFFLFMHVCVIICGALMTVQGAKVMQVTRTQPSPTMHLPMMFVYMSVVVAGAVLCLHGVYLFMNMIQEKYIRPKNSGFAKGDA